MNEFKFVSEVIASSDSNEGYALTATYLLYEDGRVSESLRFDLETFGDIGFSVERAEKFIKKMKRAQRKHEEKFLIITHGRENR